MNTRIQLEHTHSLIGVDAVEFGIMHDMEEECHYYGLGLAGSNNQRFLADREDPTGFAYYLHKLAEDFKADDFVVIEFPESLQAVAPFLFKILIGDNNPSMYFVDDSVHLRHTDGFITTSYVTRINGTVFITIGHD